MKQERAPKAYVIGSCPNRKIYIHVYRKTPSVNEWNNKKHHRFIYGRIKTQWRGLLVIAFVGCTNVFFERAEIKVIRFTSTRKLDHGNAQDGIKPIVDCLLIDKGRGLGIIRDDSPTFMPSAPTVEQRKVNGRMHEKTLIKITELE